MNKKVIYTAIYGNKDTLKDPLYHNKDFDYICFTDNKDLKSDIWKVIYSKPYHKDPVRSAKIFKVKPHEFLRDYETSIWIDANFIICSDLNQFLNKFGTQANMLTFEHDQGRNCIYDEAKIIIEHNKDNPDIVTRQMEKYKLEEFPEQTGLTANSILLRRHNKEDIIELMELWWDEIEEFSRRDQLSFYYCKWKLKTKMFMLRYPNYNIRMNDWFRWLPHNYESQPWSL
jgi:hypothetical protein